MGNNLEPMSWNYVAAFLDGEGSAMVHEKWNEVGLQWANTHKAILEEIQIFLKCGRVVPSGVKKVGWNQGWALVIRKWNDCLRIGKELLPRCRVKHKALEKLIYYIEHRQWRTNPRAYKQRPEITEEVLNELYLVRKMGIQEIANTLGCVKQTIWKKLKKYEIPTRPCSESQLLFWSNHKMKDFRRY